MKENDIKPCFGSEGLFAASNSSHGFKSYYDDIFDRTQLKRIYIIKGGPGTGKSRFMKEVSSYCEGRGYRAEYYNCSSDPDSLDAVIIDGRVALLDGTAPHTAEPDIAGARDEIINLGAFWDGNSLAGRYHEIEELCNKKSAAYSKGYHYLSGCGELAEINRALILPAIKEEKMKRYISRIISDIPQGDGARIIPALVDSIGMKGRVKYDTYERCAKKVYTVIDHYGGASLFLAALICEAQNKNIPMRVSYNPVNSSFTDAVYFLNCDIAFVIAEPSEVDESCGIRINMKRFVDKSALDKVKREFRNNLRLYEALLSSACDAFSEAGEYHFSLEKIYVSCMDFTAKESYTASFCEMLGEYLRVNI